VEPHGDKSCKYKADRVMNYELTWMPSYETATISDRRRKETEETGFYVLDLFVRV